MTYNQPSKASINKYNAMKHDYNRWTEQQLQFIANTRQVPLGHVHIHKASATRSERCMCMNMYMYMYTHEASVTKTERYIYTRAQSDRAVHAHTNTKSAQTQFTQDTIQFFTNYTCMLHACINAWIIQNKLHWVVGMLASFLKKHCSDITP